MLYYAQNFWLLVALIAGSPIYSMQSEKNNPTLLQKVQTDIVKSMKLAADDHQAVINDWIAINPPMTEYFQQHKNKVLNDLKNNELEQLIEQSKHEKNIFDESELQELITTRRLSSNSTDPNSMDEIYDLEPKDSLISLSFFNSIKQSGFYTRLGNKNQ